MIVPHIVVITLRVSCTIDIQLEVLYRNIIILDFEVLVMLIYRASLNLLSLHSSSANHGSW